MFHLAQTAWPRFGGDQANRSLLSIAGPHTMPRWQTVLLPHLDLTPKHLERANSGVILMPDATLRVCHAGQLLAVTLDGIILWQVDLTRLVSNDAYWISSLPTALHTGETLLLLPDALLLIDAFGEIRRQEHRVTSADGITTQRGFHPHDIAFSPHLTYSGQLIFSAVTGEIFLFTNHQWQEIGVYGYDLVNPAVYPDNSLAIAGYYMKGFCRVNLNGEIQWTTHLKEADLLPTLNTQQIAAVGSCNDACSAFFTSEGAQIGEYPQAANFAVYPDGGWIALSSQRLARLTVEGKEIWGREIAPNESSSWEEQPLVDKDGFIYVRQQEGFLCCDPHGRTVFEVHLPVPSYGLMSIVAPGVLVYALENELYLGYG